MIFQESVVHSDSQETVKAEEWTDNVLKTVTFVCIETRRTLDQIQSVILLVICVYQRQ